MQSMSVSATGFQGAVLEEIERLKNKSKDFIEAYDTYIQQYGKEKVRPSEPIDLSGAIDPVVLILGRNCVITFADSTRRLKGGLGSIDLREGSTYIIGRREPQDSKVVIWNSKSEEGLELEEYNSNADTIPSRVHSAIAISSDGKILFADLGSSAGTVVVGQSPKIGGAFVRIYDPGSENSPSIKFDRILTTRGRAF